MNSAHLNPDLLEALLPTAERGLRSTVAREAEITPGHLHDFLTARRFGSDPRIQQAVADAIATVTGVPVTVAAITCRCSDPGSHRKVAA